MTIIATLNQKGGYGSLSLVTKLHLGTEMDAKLSLACKDIPKHSLGTRR